MFVNCVRADVVTFSSCFHILTLLVHTSHKMAEIEQQNSRHKCQHNQRGNITYGTDAPSTSSEYSKEYVQHQIERRQPYKPVQQTAAADGSLDDKTTHRLDYVKHPMEKPYVHPKENYKTPDGEMEMSTNYSQDFTKKKLEQVKPIRHQEQAKALGKFDGEPTYAADYRTWEVTPHQKVGPKGVYQPPTDPFGGNSNYKSDYQSYSGAARRQTMKPKEQPRVSDQPFDDATEHRQSYIKHPLESGLAKSPNRNRPAYQPNTAPFDDMSSYRMEYTQKDVSAGKQVSCRPDPSPYKSEAPFEGGTTNRADYVGRQGERVKRREQAPYEKPAGDMDMTTTSNLDYTRKQLEPQQPIKPSYSRHLPVAKFDATTNYKTEYLQWSPGERPQPMKKDQYAPNDAPFEGQPTYRRDYVKHSGAVMTRSLKPADPGYSSNAPLEDGTEYRHQYTSKKMDPCLAHQLVNASDPADHGYEFHGQDDKGHVWYRPGPGIDTSRG